MKIIFSKFYFAGYASDTLCQAYFFLESYDILVTHRINTPTEAGVLLYPPSKYPGMFYLRPCPEKCLGRQKHSENFQNSLLPFCRRGNWDCPRVRGSCAPSSRASLRPASLVVPLHAHSYHIITATAYSQKATEISEVRPPTMNEERSTEAGALCCLV